MEEKWEIMQNDSNRKLENVKRTLAMGIVFLSVCILIDLGFPNLAYADIKSSVNSGGDEVYQTIKDVSGKVAIAIVAGGFFATMMPLIELSQKAKMVIIKALVGVVGINFAVSFVEWVQNMK